MENKSARFKTVLESFNPKLWGLHFKVPEDIAQNFVEHNGRRVLVSINGQFTHHAAIMPNKGIWFVLLNKKIQKDLNLEINQSIEVTIVKDESKYGMEMPIELEEMFSQEEYASEVFESLTPGKQRNLIHIVNSVKNTDSRIRKSLAIVDHLKECQGKIDFKRLHILIKQYNNM